MAQWLEGVEHISLVLCICGWTPTGKLEAATLGLVTQRWKPGGELDLADSAMKHSYRGLLRAKYGLTKTLWCLMETQLHLHHQMEHLMVQAKEHICYKGQMLWSKWSEWVREPNNRERQLLWALTSGYKLMLCGGKIHVQFGWVGKRGRKSCCVWRTL